MYMTQLYIFVKAVSDFKGKMKSEMVQVGNDEEMAQSERNSKLHKPRAGEKIKCHLGTYTKNTYRKPSEQLFPNRRPFCYPN